MKKVQINILINTGIFDPSLLMTPSKNNIDTSYNFIALSQYYYFLVSSFTFDQMFT